MSFHINLMVFPSSSLKFRSSSAFSANDSLIIITIFVFVEVDEAILGFLRDRVFANLGRCHIELLVTEELEKSCVCDILAEISDVESE